MKPLHVICVSTYSSVAEAYKCALKGISGSQKNKHVKMFVPPSCPTTTVCSIDGSLSVSSRRGGADVYIRPLAVIVCVCVTVCVSSDVVVITVGCFFFFEGQPPNLSRTCLPAASVALRKDFNKALVSVYQHTSVVPSLNNLIFTTNMLPV